MGETPTTFDALKALQRFFRDDEEEARARIQWPLLDDPVFGVLVGAALEADEDMAGEWADAPEGMVRYFASMSDDQLARLLASLPSHASDQLRADVLMKLLI